MESSYEEELKKSKLKNREDSENRMAEYEGYNTMIKKLFTKSGLDKERSHVDSENLDKLRGKVEKRKRPKTAVEKRKHKKPKFKHQASFVKGNEQPELDPKLAKIGKALFRPKQLKDKKRHHKSGYKPIKEVNLTRVNEKDYVKTLLPTVDYAPGDIH